MFHSTKTHGAVPAVGDPSLHLVCSTSSLRPNASCSHVIGGGVFSEFHQRHGWNYPLDWKQTTRHAHMQQINSDFILYFGPTKKKGKLNRHEETPRLAVSREKSIVFPRQNGIDHFLVLCSCTHPETSNLKIGRTPKGNSSFNQGFWGAIC